MSTVLLQCHSCGKTYERPSWRQPKPKYCSYECSHRGKKSGVLVPCIQCGQLVSRRPCENRERVFCNRVCFYAWKKSQGASLLQEANRAKGVHESISFLCDWCSKECVEQYSTYQKSKKHFCSRECQYAWKRDHYSKSLKAIRTDSRDVYAVNRWRSAVIEKDGKVCARCGAHKNLHAHHVRPWKKFPDLRFDVGNGQTLCGSCHYYVHSNTGRENEPSWLVQG